MDTLYDLLKEIENLSVYDRLRDFGIPLESLTTLEEQRWGLKEFQIPKI